MITTKYGPIEERYLKRLDSTVDNDNEFTQVVEYFLMDECVHRSVTINLKKGMGIEAILGQIG